MFAMGFKLFLQIQIAHKIPKNITSKKIEKKKKKKTIDKWYIRCNMFFYQSNSY